MAIISPVTLSISRSGADALIEVRYTITGDIRDRITNQPYVEICRLIGDDTPGDGTDDIIRDGTLQDKVVAFTFGRPDIPRVIKAKLPASFLDEDSGGPALDVDEIRAEVSLIPVLPTMSSRESNQVQFNVPINEQGTRAPQ